MSFVMSYLEPVNLVTLFQYNGLKSLVGLTKSLYLPEESSTWLLSASSRQNRGIA